MAAFLLTSRVADAMSVAAARRLRTTHALHPGDRLGIVTPSPGGPAAAQAEAAVATLAYGALRCGIVPVMINPLLSVEEANGYLRDVDASLVVSGGGAAELTSPDGPGAGAGPELADVPLGRPMHFTSGTTGRSKGVWSGVLEEAAAQRYWDDEHAQWPIEAGDVLLNHGPLAHSAPLRFSFLAFRQGADVLYTGGFDAAAAAHAISDYSPTVAMAVPTHLQRILQLPGGPPPSTYRMLIHAGSACPPDLKRTIHQWAGVDRVWEFLGSTEGQFTACRGVEWEERPGTLGRARLGRRLLIDDGSWSSQPGVIWCEVGEVGGFEYYGDPEKTSQVWRTAPSGRTAFTVGDLGRLDDDGYLFLQGRRTDLIVTGGVNVYPAEVEAELRECPHVHDVAVYGVPDARWGDRVCAAVVTTSPARLDDIRAWARIHMAAYRRPKVLVAVAELPLTSSGKVRRDGLAHWVAQHSNSPQIGRVPGLE